MAGLRDNVERMQKAGSEQLNTLDGMSRFFIQHEIGKALVALATERVENGRAEADYQELLKGLRSPLDGLHQAAQQIAKSPAAKSKGVAHIVQDLSPVVESLQELEACAFLKRKAAQKADSETGLSAVETVQSCSDRLSKAAVTMVQHELSMNVSEHLRLGCLPVAAFECICMYVCM